jgi:hypothetical protein
LITIDLVYFDAGGGHRAAATALQGFIGRRHPDWTVRLVHLFQVLDPQQRFRRATGMAPEDYYNKRLAHGWTLGLKQELRILQGMIRLAHPLLVDCLKAHWGRTRPDLVVSLVPNFNRALGQSLEATCPGAPFITVMTDLADYPPHFWIEPDLGQIVVCGTAHAVRQALQAGVPAARIRQVSGMLLRPEFYELPPCDRAAERARLGLDPSRPVGLVMFGGQGARAMRTIAKELGDQQLILVCGHNAQLVKALRATQARSPHAVIGFTREVARLMQIADYFIGKPGPGSLSEAVHMGLPVIVARNAWTMPQERFNPTWVLENQLGLVLPGFGAIRGAVDHLLDRLPDYRDATTRLRNRAGFEMVDILAALLRDRAAAQPLEAALAA